MTAPVAARARLAAASRALVTAIRAEARATDDAELRALLEASSAAVERETRRVARASQPVVADGIRDLEWRLAVLVGRLDDRAPLGWRRDAALTDFLVDDRVLER